MLSTYRRRQIRLDVVKEYLSIAITYDLLAGCLIAKYRY